MKMSYDTISYLLKELFTEDVNTKMEVFNWLSEYYELNRDFSKEDISKWVVILHKKYEDLLQRKLDWVYFIDQIDEDKIYMTKLIDIPISPLKPTNLIYDDIF